MKKLTGSKSTWGLFIYSIGVLLGMLLFGLVVWGNFEAFLFDPVLSADENIRSMKCPIMITTSEIGTVTAELTNPGDRAAQTTVRAHISDGMFLMMREVVTRIQLEPGETKQLEWTISAEDAAWERLVLIRVYSIRSSPIPSYTGTCGIILIDLPILKGNQVVALISTFSLISMVAGLWLWVSTNQPLSRRNRYATQILAVLAALVLIGIVLGILRLWLLGGILFFFTVLLVVIVIAYFLIATENGGAL